MPEPKDESNGLGAENSLDATNSHANSSDKEKQPSTRRQFVTGMATVLGGGLLINAGHKLSTTEDSATEVRSRILSRIQEDLKRSQNELVFGYDKPDSATPHGRYVKADGGSGPAPVEPGNS